MIQKVAIRNYRLFKEFDLDFLPGINILVGANDTGKSTLIEAINLALTGRLHGRWLAQELSPYLINLNATREYIDKLQTDDKAIPSCANTHPTHQAASRELEFSMPPNR